MSDRLLERLGSRMFGATDALQYSKKALSSIVVDNLVKSPPVNGVITVMFFVVR